MMDWKDVSDWSGLPDVYVTNAQCADGMFWRIEACSVPLALAPEVRLIRADRVAAAIASARAQALDEAEARVAALRGADIGAFACMNEVEGYDLAISQAEAAIRALSHTPDTTTPVIEAAHEVAKMTEDFARDPLRAALAAHEARHE